MKKGEAGLTIMISLIVIIIILIQYLIFFVFFPHKTVIINEYESSESGLFLINFARLNSDLIATSAKEDNYNELEEKIKNMEIKKCFEIKIKEKTFKNCNVKNPEMSIITIPNYDNNPIKITLLMEKE